MSWSADLPSYKVAPHLSSITPSEVLYEFDGPQIFLASFGFVKTIFVKADDLEVSCLWTVAQIEEKTSQYIMENRVSVRCPFNQDFIWVVRTDYELNVIEYWSCESASMPEDMLPVSGATLDGQLEMPDSVAQADAFFAMQFKGENINTYGKMRFSQYKTLLDNAYEATRRILGPTSLAGSRSNVYDFEVRQSAGSIIISIEGLFVNQKAAERRLKQEYVASSINEEVEYLRDGFLIDIDEIVKEGFSARKADRHFSVIDFIMEIIPDKDSDISSVTFSARGVKKRTTIGRDDGEALRAAYDEFSTRTATETGRIEIINSNSNSFVILSEVSKRQVTCYISAPDFAELQEDRRFRNGVKISVTGDFWKRPNRDAISATRIPRIVN